VTEGDEDPTRFEGSRSAGVIGEEPLLVRDTLELLAV